MSLDQALEYNEDPRDLAALLLHKLTVEVRRFADSSQLSRRELARRLETPALSLARPRETKSMTH